METINNNRMIFIGPLPPPIHGMSAMNKAILDQLLVDGIQTETINTAPNSLNRNLFTLLSRLHAIVTGLFQLLGMLSTRKKKTVYISLSGGWGLLYDLLMVFLSRVFRSKFILHHHSYAFLIKPKKLSAILFKLAGKDSTHIVLCNKMAKDIMEKYAVKNCFVMSNLASMPVIQNGKERSKLMTIGFIGNITMEKGGHLVIKLAKEIADSQWPIKFIVGGPCPDPKLEILLKKAVKDGIIDWIGPVYNKDKEHFLAAMDVMIMPTQYPNEAEPLVVWESLGSGVPVIAYARGCISSQITNDAGEVIPIDKNFISEAKSIIKNWLDNPNEYHQASISALKIYQNGLNDKITAKDNFKALINA